MSFQYIVTLQVWHPHADPEMIERGLAMSARHKHTRGTSRQTPTGSRLLGGYRESYCSFDLGAGDDGQLASYLKELVDSLSAKREYIAQIKQTGGRLNFYVGWTCGERGEVFDVELLSRLAWLGVDLGIEPFRTRQRRSPG